MNAARNRAMTALVSAAALCARAEPPSTNTLERLRAGLAGTTSIRAEYTQEKTLSLFKQTLVIKGRMLLDAKGSLLWTTDEPARSALTIKDATLRQWDADSNRVTSMPVSRVPVLPGLATQAQAWLRGDFDALSRDYAVRVESDSPPVLVCAPRQPGSTPFTRVTLTFNEAPVHLRRAELLEEGGNRAVFHFTRVELNIPVQDADWEIPPKTP